jgi:hypothetical protein
LLQIRSFLCRFAANPFLFVFLVQQNPRLNGLDYLYLQRFSQGSSRFAAGPFLFVPLVPQNPSARHLDYPMFPGVSAVAPLLFAPARTRSAL